jgi:hypothetical protein
MNDFFKKKFYYNYDSSGEMGTDDFNAPANIDG